MNKIDTTVLKSLFLDYWKNIMILVLCFFLYRGCQERSKVQIVKVTVPEVKGSFQEKKPEHFPFGQNLSIEKSPKKESVIKPKFITENKKLTEDFKKANDTLKAEIFDKAIKLKSFSSTFENDTIKIDITGIVQGEVKEISPSYVIKERKVEVLVKPKETVFRILGGVEVGGTTQLNNFVAKANLIIQNRKGNTNSISYDTNKTIWIGKSWSIFSVKR